MRIGIDLGGTKISGILQDPRGDVVAKERVATPAAGGYAAILAGVADIAIRLRAASSGPCSIGVGTPGAISSKTGMMKNCNTIALNGQPLRQDLERLLDQTVCVANDANCFALAEAHRGAARGYHVVFGVILGTGVGGGWVLNGKGHDGPNFIAGEWGHNPLHDDGRTCYCGRRACVETFLSGPGLVAAHGGDITVPEIVARARAREPRAQKVFTEYLQHFGRALANVINMMDPDVIVLGGGLSSIEELYTEGRAHVERYVFNDELRTPIVKNALGDDSGVYGAAELRA